jgi:hypothetical protein
MKMNVEVESRSRRWIERFRELHELFLTLRVYQIALARDYFSLSMSPLKYELFTEMGKGITSSFKLIQSPAVNSPSGLESRSTKYCEFGSALPIWIHVISMSILVNNLPSKTP